MREMKQRFFASVIIVIAIVFFSCDSKLPAISILSRNDTIRIVQTLIDSNLNLPWLADFQRLYVNNPFKDTIIVLADTLLYRNWPSYYKFKFMTQDSICALAVKYKDSADFPNFLQFTIWKENDSVYGGRIKNFMLENRSNCLIALNHGCDKIMTFKKTEQGLVSKKRRNVVLTFSELYSLLLKKISI